ncbi:LLM class flavin-dependent oxidoreductase [Devosia sp.]|uniref:LLM class flavin-dependent oxidoreductase n=1 Tax=Devosia sp. TaxID=1871048 RepID=UPI001ACC71A3|nr:LLM class flavin-dependent oxidoreductase [Devosia sp.]MBN9332622.1 LLM class flavin-dependent oxidoreductase [Devosia sp.]
MTNAYASPASYPGSPLSQIFAQPLFLGLFLPIQAGGWSPSTLERTTDWSFEYNKRLTLTAEALGFDLVFALSQWLPKGGHSEVFNGEALDSFIAMAALAGVTERIALIATVHVLYGPWHPLHMAKFGATLDHITGGRWGLNIVTGHRAVEHEMFGYDAQIEHDLRYELAAEFIETVTKLWHSEENFSYAGKSSWRLKDAFVTPRPNFGRPILINATGSDAGIDFASRYSDIVFITNPTGADMQSAREALPAHTARIKQAARDRGREVKLLINPMVVARDTEKEAWAQADAIVAHADPTNSGGFGKYKTDSHAWRGRAGKVDPYGVVGGNIRVVGTPEQVVDDFATLKAAGIDGLQISFFDFEPDLAYFGERILPLMKQAGLRLY